MHNFSSISGSRDGLLVVPLGIEESSVLTQNDIPILE